jgi:mono/diheme cytochrome c family protein
MTRPNSKIDEERRSYSVVFLLAVGLLLAGALWAVWDDNISRRPWKKYQVEFSELQIERAEKAVRDEESRLAADPAYVKAKKELADARARIASGETARQLASLKAQRDEAKVHVDEREFKLRIVKSKLGEAWYEYEHAELTGGETDGFRKHVDELDAGKKRAEASLAQAQAKLDKVSKEIEEIRSVEQGLVKKIGDFETGLDGLRQKLDRIELHVGPFGLPKIPKIQQVVLNEFDHNNFDEPVARVDRCESCHAGVNKAGFEDDPEPFTTHPHRDTLLKDHPPEKFGCTPCHEGQGAAVSSVDKAHGDVPHWEHPLRRGKQVQSSCIGCHVDVRVPGAETIAEGEKLFEQVGCTGCHLVEGYGELGKIGPYLRRIAAKDDPGWLVRWVENPHRFRPHTKMPNFAFSREQATEIVAYLLSASHKESEEWLSHHPMPTGVDPNDARLVERGKRLADSLGCRGCHGFVEGEAPARLGTNKNIVPNLSKVAEKTNARWVYHWLKNPRGFSPVSRMPSLRLSDEEAAALSSYLLTLGTPKPADAELKKALASPDNVSKGAALIRKYGCEGCHDIPGMETEARIGVELTTFGSKPLERLFFGQHTDIPHTWRDWAYNKLKEPRTYATERIEQLMPQFDLGEEDIQALLVFLASRQEDKVPSKYFPADLERERTLQRGRRVVEKYNCIGCHVIEKRGGAILAFYRDKPTYAPPVLNGEGAKVQPNWLYGFLKSPVPLRPWLKLRMPTFPLTDEEAGAIVEYFLAQEKIQVPFVYVNQKAIPKNYVEAGRKLASPDYFNCFSCHQQGDRKPEGPEAGWAPDLVMAKRRLNPDWIIRWIRDPQALQPGTKMPAFYNFNDDIPDGPDDVLGGDDARQVEALRDFVLTLKPISKPVVAAAEPVAANIAASETTGVTDAVANPSAGQSATN